MHSSTNDLQQSNASRLYFWDGPNGLSLVVLHDTTFDGDGGAVRFEFEGLPDGNWVARDDPVTHNDAWGESYVDWQWVPRNTDGGAYRAPLRDAEITITPQFQRGIDEWQLLSAKTGAADEPLVIPLDTDRPVTILGPDAPESRLPLQVYPYEFVTGEALTALSGLAWPPLEFRLENTASEAYENVTLDAAVPSEGLTVTGSTPPDSLDPGAVHDTRVDVEATSDASGQYPIDLTLSATDLEETDLQFSASVEETLTTDVGPAVGVASDLEAGDREPVAFTIEANDVLGVDDVEAVFRVGELPGEWSRASKNSVGSAVRPDGGAWERQGPDWVWTKGRMSAGETQRPEITFRIPDDIDAGEYTLPVELSARDGSDDQVKTVNTVDASVTVDQTLVEASVETTETTLVPGSDLEVSVDLRVLGEPVRNPQVRLQGFPGAVELADATASDGGTARIRTGEITWNWSGEQDPEQRYGGKVTVRLPEDADAPGGSFSFAGRATATAVATGATDEDGLSGTLAISGLASFTSSKRDLARRLDGTAPILSFREAETVDPILTEITNAVERERTGEDGVTLTVEQAEEAVERLLLGERAAHYCMALVGPAEPLRPNLDDGRLARRTASNALASTVGLLLCVVSVAKLAKIARRVPRVGGRFASWLDDVARTFADVVRQLVTLGGRFDGIARQHTDNIASEIAGRGQVNALQAVDIVNEEIAAATELTRDVLISSGVVTKLQLPLHRLNRTMEAEAVESGLPGSLADARDGFSGGLNFMRYQYRRADDMLNDIEDSFVADFTNAGGDLAELTISLLQVVVDVLTLDPDDAEGSLLQAMRSLAFAVKEAFDGLVDFLGPFHSTVLSNVATGMITRTSRTAIAGVTNGVEPEFGF